MQGVHACAHMSCVRRGCAAIMHASISGTPREDTQQTDYSRVHRVTRRRGRAGLRTLQDRVARPRPGLWSALAVVAAVGGGAPGMAANSAAARWVAGLQNADSVSPSSWVLMPSECSLPWIALWILYKLLQHKRALIACEAALFCAPLSSSVRGM